MSFSNSGGGTIALPSPTHGHHIDVTSAVRNLRRSMSRSPSKLLSRTNSPGPEASRPASPQSPCRRLRATPQKSQWNLPSSTQTHSAPAASGLPTSSNTQYSSVFTPLRTSSKLSLRSTKSARTLSPRPIGRARVSPKSPLKRALNANNDSGNSAPVPSATPTGEPFMGQENLNRGPSSPISRYNFHKPSRHSLHLDVSGASQAAFLKALDFKSDSVLATTGALKRSDATMNLDQPNAGSPVAKRRSMHGISSLDPSGSLNMFGFASSTPKKFSIHDDSSLAQNVSTSPAVSPPSQAEPIFSSTPLSGLPKRTSSLRKSTLQQRHGDKGSLSRRTGERQLAQMSNSEVFTPGRLRPRLSTEHFFPPPAPRESIFSSAIPLPSASSHPMDTKGGAHQPHPLSKAISPSSTGSSLSEEPSLYAPVPATESIPKPHPFSRSLPVNAPRPTAARGSHQPGGVAATPVQTAKLWAGAFNSTGLISKVNRNPEDDAKKIVPPDTPCKKHPNNFATFPPPLGSAIKKKKKNSNRNSFGGVPSTPFNPATADEPDTFGHPGKGLSIFQRGSASRSARRGSFLLLDEDDDTQLFGDAYEKANLMDADAPPTPTKNLLTTSLSNVSEQSNESPSANRTFCPPTSAVRPPISRNSTSKFPLRSHDDSNVDSVQGVVRRPMRSHPYRASITSLHSLSNMTESIETNTSRTNSASPVSGRRTPQTPQENLLPLDTSRLSISHGAGEVAPGEINMPPPVTPTTRDFRSSTSIFVTPVNGRTASLDIDSSLYARFDKVEQIGKGEFSTVYKVTKESTAQDALDILTSTTPRNSLIHSPAKGQVFAVKKSRRPYQGARDRESKLREAQILRALTHAEHVVRYVDEWEHQLHLYIQTEYCEEGALDHFLTNIGFQGRLDDFRIFKILQDLCLGLKEIHDAGFMHLDMKPANILVDFEGTLKIADFGLAQSMSDSKRIDVEGDREYMAPEMLEGKAGPSADIFSVGLMILETAANVMLPDNGPSWVRLRSGDLSEVPSLTWTPSSEVQQDVASIVSDDLQDGRTHNPGNLFGSYKRLELQQPPEFMVHADNGSSLDSVVRWMTSQEPGKRPTAADVLDLDGLRWIAEHRSAPTTVFEGHWGPVQFVPISLADDGDTEMMDV